MNKSILSHYYVAWMLSVHLDPLLWWLMVWRGGCQQEKPAQLLWHLFHFFWWNLFMWFEFLEIFKTCISESGQNWKKKKRTSKMTIKWCFPVIEINQAKRGKGTNIQPLTLPINHGLVYISTLIMLFNVPLFMNSYVLNYMQQSGILFYKLVFQLTVGCLLCATWSRGGNGLDVVCIVGNMQAQPKPNFCW